jgi:hypothetical protein
VLLSGLVAAGVALLVTLFACGLVGCCDECDDDSLRVPLAGSDGFVEAADENVDPLVLQFAPVVWLHRREAYGPTSTAEFLSRSELTWRTESRFSRDVDLARRGAIDPARLGFACASAPIGCYRFDQYLATDFTRPHDRRPERAPGLNDEEGFYIDPDDAARKGEAGIEPKAPMYYEITRRETRTRITYWFFYGFSVPYKPAGPFNLARLFSHEGDWENVDVVLDAEGTPLSVAYYGHGHPRPIPWEDVCKVVEDGEDCDSAEPGRPVVYSARHSHASYPTAAEGHNESTKVCANNRFHRPCSYDLREKGFVWDPLAAGGMGLRDARAEPWYGFGGAWGSAGLQGDTTGPLGPSSFKLPDEEEPGELRAVTPPVPPAG